MAAPSIIAGPINDQRFHRDPQRYSVELKRSFALGCAEMRIPVELKTVRGNSAVVADSYRVKFRHEAAAKYFRKRLAQFIREIDGTIVIEDPPNAA